MKQRAMRTLFLAAVMLTSALGCWNSDGIGECSSDSDLVMTDSNFHENAICEDGHAACAEGNEPCKYVTYRESKGVEQFTYGCVPKEKAADQCISCPEGMSLCIFFSDDYSNGHSWTTCTEEIADCWAMTVMTPENIPGW